MNAAKANAVDLDSHSMDGTVFTPLFTFPSASIPAPVAGTTPALVSVASHGGTKGTMIEVGAPTKTLSFGSGAMKDAVDAIESARDLEAQARSNLRNDNTAGAHAKLVLATTKLDQAIAAIKASIYGGTAPGNAAVKSLGAAKKFDLAADAAADSKQDAARGKLNEAEKHKAEALVHLRRL